VETGSNGHEVSVQIDNSNPTKFSNDLWMSRRLSESAGLKGVTTIRNGATYSVTLPKFTPLPNASSISISADKVHEEFRKLTPKQRIAVLTVKDPGIATKLYGLSNVRYGLFYSFHPIISHCGPSRCRRSATQWGVKHKTMML
jgi:hypothetical protein